MKRFIQGEHRGQSTLLPESLDDYVSDTNPVRVVDVFVDELDLVNLGFEGAIPADTGRPAYHPAILLKIYIYGYLNRIQSSRRLEREAQRNVELMWLTGRLMPDFKTIANFRKDNSKAIRGVCRQFVVLCQQLGLFGENLVAIDGSKFKAVNNRDRNFTSAKLKRRMEEIESSISRYLTALDAADRQEPTASEPNAVRLEEKIAKLKTQMKELQAIETQLNESPGKQVSLTDPDARSMMTRGTGIVGYFECRRGGMRVTDGSRYISIPVTMATLGGTLAWIKTELGGRYCELYLIVGVATKLSWSEVVINSEIALLAGQAGAAIKVAFKRA